MNTAIVILNWNGLQLLKTFLPSVVAHADNAKVYVIDNASSDDSVAYLKNNIPRLRSSKIQKMLALQEATIAD